ncbi:MAG TPA: hypothetical protein VKC34_07710, partial [Blastocatellia bacterium]|nr:hypothetical protein [Blastocatellia bacterium]
GRETVDRLDARRLIARAVVIDVRSKVEADSDAAIGYLLRERKIVALGIDTLSIDYGLSADFSGHRLSHASGLYHIENLANLDELPARGSVIFVGPLLIQGGSGSPARVLAVAP